MNKPCSPRVPIREHARREVVAITNDFDWSKARPIPRQAIEELMINAYVRGGAYVREEVEGLHPDAVINPADLLKYAESFSEGFGVHAALKKAAEEIMRQRAYIDALHYTLDT